MQLSVHFDHIRYFVAVFMTVSLWFLPTDASLFLKIFKRSNILKYIAAAFTIKSILSLNSPHLQTFDLPVHHHCHQRGNSINFNGWSDHWGTRESIGNSHGTLKRKKFTGKRSWRTVSPGRITAMFFIRLFQSLIGLNNYHNFRFNNYFVMFIKNNPKLL